jgi:homoserine dehydrogenase
MKLILIGLGTVGRGLLRIFHDKRAELESLDGFRPIVIGVVTRTRGTLYHPDGLEIERLLSLERLGDYPDTPGLERGWDAERIVRASDADALVEASPSNFQTGQPALGLCLAALATGKHVVLANKGPVAVAYDELREQAKQAGRLLRFEGTVMAGTPSLRLGMQALLGCRIESARGILNGTTNYILTQMESGMSYDDALAQAQALGYAESDPSADVDGWDAAAKAIIVARALFGKHLTFDAMQVKGISAITPEDIAFARASGERWKLIAEVSRDGGSVPPVRISVSHPLAGVSGTTNAITYATDLLGDVTLIGAGAGGAQTGFALLSDLLEIYTDSTSR